MVINVLIADLIPANPIEYFANQAQANTNRSITEQSRSFTVNKVFDFAGSITDMSYFTLLSFTLRNQTIVWVPNGRLSSSVECSITEPDQDHSQ